MRELKYAVYAASRSKYQDELQVFQFSARNSPAEWLWSNLTEALGFSLTEQRYPYRLPTSREPPPLPSGELPLAARGQLLADREPRPTCGRPRRTCAGRLLPGIRPQPCKRAT